MKGKRIVALVLAGCMTFGQTVWAEGTVKEERKKGIVNETETSEQTKSEEQRTEKENEEENYRIIFCC